MRQNLVVALLCVGCTLLAANLVVTLRSSGLPAAYGQAVGAPSGQVVLATGQNQGGSEAVVYVYDVPTRKLGCYTTKGQGIELKGMRDVTWDFKLQELLPANANKRLTVKQVREELAKLEGGEEK
ncbi:MAG: hypothetical protein HY721_28660 [Planctomycetes bacterium]|nr:hypothetical protein [Planctomycetota bacterium]